jgi:GNAT superfamily N-acetyltransferase
MDTLPEPPLTLNARVDPMAQPWQFRPARAEDAAVCAPLVFASGVGEFGFFLGLPPEQCIAFIQAGFASRYGRYSWRRHRVAVAPDGRVVAVMAIHDGRETGFDDPYITWSLLRCFGWRMAGMSRRGLVLESELPALKRTERLIAQCSTDARVRGTGIFTALFRDALSHGLLDAGPGRTLVIDVRANNARARSLYERLGFVLQPRSHPPSPHLPPELVSLRLAWPGRAIPNAI